MPARTERNGWRFDWLTFDEWYGGKPGFLRVLDVAALRYVGEAPKTFSCRPGPSRTALSAEAVFSQPGVKKRAAKSFRLGQQTGPAAVWQAKVVDVAVGIRDAWTTIAASVICFRMLNDEYQLAA